MSIHEIISLTLTVKMNQKPLPFTNSVSMLLPMSFNLLPCVRVTMVMWNGLTSLYKAGYQLGSRRQCTVGVGLPKWTLGKDNLFIRKSPLGRRCAMLLPRPLVIMQLLELHHLFINLQVNHH